MIGGGEGGMYGRPGWPAALPVQQRTMMPTHFMDCPLMTRLLRLFLRIAPLDRDLGAFQSLTGAMLTTVTKQKSKSHANQSRDDERRHGADGDPEAGRHSRRRIQD